MRTLDERRKYIRRKLEWFYVNEKEFSQEIYSDPDSNPQHYFEKYLATLFSNYYKKIQKQDGIFQSEIFDGLLQLCFSGELTTRIWQKLWSYLEDADMKKHLNRVELRPS